MAVKTTGAEFKLFYECDNPEFWPNESWVEEMVLTVNGATHGDSDETIDVSEIPDDAIVRLEYGHICTPDMTSNGLEKVFRRWRKAQTSTQVVVSIPNDKLDIVRAAIKAAGGRVL